MIDRSEAPGSKEPDHMLHSSLAVHTALLWLLPVSLSLSLSGNCAKNCQANMF
jgi:hypothetical protein